MSSMGGNGAKVDYPGVPTMGFAPPYDMIPADLGGGCVTDGPFKKCVSTTSSRKNKADLSTA
jgi:tyrosinase